MWHGTRIHAHTHQFTSSKQPKKRNDELDEAMKFIYILKEAIATATGYDLLNDHKLKCPSD